jgi:hypothetical protein
MRILTLIQFLFGTRRGIFSVAACRHAAWLGLVFVISAGFAREYDGEDLLHEPWHLALPLAASLLTSFLLFLLLEAAFAEGYPGRGKWRCFLSRYAAFLGLYWMTAPLAWLYAVPVERFLDAPDAVRVNLSVLGIVSAWRVALMTRAVSVIYARSGVAAFFVVMLFADTVALAVFWLTPLPILRVMGGIRLTESEQVIQATGFMVRILGAATWLIWLVGALVVMARSRGRQPEQPYNPSALATSRHPVSRGLWVLAAASLLIWAPILPLTQGEQINRRHVETELRKGRIAGAIQFMSQRAREDFPPHWDPPPRAGYGETRPLLVDVLLHLDQPGAALWVKELFRHKLVVQAHADPWNYYGHAIQLGEMDEARLAHYARFLQSAPEGPAMAQYHEAEIRTLLEPEQYGGGHVISDRQRSSLEVILSLVPEGQARLAE